MYSPADPVDRYRPRNRARRTFLNGESDDTSEGAPAPAHPHVRISARGVIGAHTHANTCLCSRCAGVAPSIEFGISTVIIGVVAAVSAAAAPLPVTSTVPLRLVLVAASVRAIRDRGRDTKRRGLRYECPNSDKS